MTYTATAITHPNIALIKYWGNQDNALRIPSNGSISMNLGGLETHTTVTFDPALTADELILQQQPAAGSALQRASAMLGHVRALAGIQLYAHVESSNNFPTGAGVASSAAGFSALALAASRAAGLALSEPQLSCLARLGAGSACRSIPAGFVEWQAGLDHQTSFAYSIAPPDHWDLVDCIAVASQAHKTVGSTEGHALAYTSPLQSARLADTPRRLDLCRYAILARDFEALAEVVELDSNLLHAVMMTSSPRLLYWQPASIQAMHEVVAWRKQGLPSCYTFDAGPNVHVLTLAGYAPQLAKNLSRIPGILEVLIAYPGGPARLIEP